MIIPIKSKDPDKDIVNHNLYFLRYCLMGITQEAFAGWMGITRNMVNNYERNSASPTNHILISLHQKLTMDITKLLVDQMSFMNFRDFFSDPKMAIDIIREQLRNPDSKT